MPNTLARSSLFAPIAHGRRKRHDGAVLVSRSDCIIHYSGQQFDEADCDIVFQLLFVARLHPLGAAVSFKSADFLRALGRGNGNSQYLWLKRRLLAIRESMLVVEARQPDGKLKYKCGGDFKTFNILREYEFNAETEEHTIELDPRWVLLFGAREYELIDWHKRLQIRRGQDMAKSLQRLVATSNERIQRYNLDWLQSKMVYTGRRRNFKSALSAACAELIRLEIIQAWKIEISTRSEEQVAIWLPGTQSVLGCLPT